MNNVDAKYVVQTPEGGWRVNGTRVSIDSVVHAYRDGLAPEAIAAEFPSLTLEMVHGVIAFYLRNREAFDRYLMEQSTRWEQLRARSEQANSDLIANLRSRAQKVERAEE
jgi:uncharacterized protein (DUF433 family)